MLLSQSPALFACWLVWCLLHSLLASRRVKRYLHRDRTHGRHYRLAYVIFSTVTLAGLLAWQWAAIALPPAAGPLWQISRLLLAAYGLYMLWSGSRAYNLREFLGLEKFADPIDAGTVHFRRDGILGRVRHPWYSGGIGLVATLGETPLDRWDWRLLLIGYLIVGCLIEEWRLVDELGEVYRSYQREVPMLLPRIGAGGK